MSTRTRGNFYESIALRYLQNKGYSFIEANYSTTKGEIDLILKNSYYIVFVEVKGLKAESEYSLFNAITNSKKKRLKAVIQDWLNSNNFHNHAWRLDQLCVKDFQNMFKIEHFKYIEI